MSSLFHQGLSVGQKSGLSAIGLLMVGFLVLFLTGHQETHEAHLVEQSQVSLQTAVSNGVATLKMPAKNIPLDTIANATASLLPHGVKLDKDLHLTILNSNRQAQFAVSSNGDLQLVMLTNFTRFHVEKGHIVRDTRWMLPELPGLGKRQSDPTLDGGG